MNVGKPATTWRGLYRPAVPASIGFAALLVFTWYYAPTLFLIFAGVLLGLALNATTTLLGRVVSLPHSVRLTIVCLVLASLLSGVVFLGGATIAEQAAALSGTIKEQLVASKAFLERQGVDTSYFELGNSTGSSASSSATLERCSDTQSPKRGHAGFERWRDRQLKRSNC